MSTRARDGSSRQRILDAANDLFVERGYAGTSVMAIAQRVGVTPPALYWHFASKEEIFAVALEEEHEAFLERIKAAVTATDPAERLYQLVYTHVMSQLEVRDPNSATATTFTITRLVRALPERRQKRIRALQRKYVEIIESILNDGVAAGDFRVDAVRPTAFSVINLAEYVITWFDPAGPLSRPEAAHFHAILALRMVGSGAVAGESGFVPPSVPAEEAPGG